MPGIFGLPSFATYRAAALHDTRTSGTISIRGYKALGLFARRLEIGSPFGLLQGPRTASHATTYPGRKMCV